MSDMKTDGRHRVQFKSIDVYSYKGIDSLSIVFPNPLLDNDPDILVIGSENGVGKTSVLECCALIILCLRFKGKTLQLPNESDAVNLTNLLIKAGADFTEIHGDIAVDGSEHKVEIRICNDGIVEIKAPRLDLFDDTMIDSDSEVYDLIKLICGFSPNPVIESRLLYFHSYRKMEPGGIHPSILLADNQRIRQMELMPAKFVSSIFKRKIFELLLGEANLYETVHSRESKEDIEKLNSLLQLYVNNFDVKIGKLKQLSDGSNDIRIKPINNGESISIDGLSSGEKEIISILFLILHHTKGCPSVVLIDEPELHLNAQWHRSFVNNLLRTAPGNQYIIATHSEDIMDSVLQDHRTLLLRDGADING